MRADSSHSEQAGQFSRGIQFRLPGLHALHHVRLHQQADCQACHVIPSRPGVGQQEAPQVIPPFTVSLLQCAELVLATSGFAFLENVLQTS